MLGSNRLLRLFAFANHFLIFIFSIILVGILSYLLARYPNRGAHIVYQEVIAVLTLGIWLVGMLLPLFGRYRGYLAPLSWIFSYLWLTSFIFAALAWTGRRCRTRGPGPGGRCALKHTVMAFTFLVFFFLLCNIIVEALLYRAEKRRLAAAAGTTGAGSKERPGSTASDARDNQHHHSGAATSHGATGHNTTAQPTHPSATHPAGGTTNQPVTGSNV